MNDNFISLDIDSIKDFLDEDLLDSNIEISYHNLQGPLTMMQRITC